MVNSSISPKGLKKNGKCPLTPEEVALVLSALGFEPSTYIFLAGSSIYGGKSRLGPLSKLFPNMVTKEDLLTPSELAPFKNFSNQVLELSYIPINSTIMCSIRLELTFSKITVGGIGLHSLCNI